jgi:hypothetical protein
MTPEDTRYTSLSAVRVAILSLALSLFVGWRVFFPPAAPQPAAVTEPSAVTEARGKRALTPSLRARFGGGGQTDWQCAD